MQKKNAVIRILILIFMLAAATFCGATLLYLLRPTPSEPSTLQDGLLREPTDTVSTEPSEALPESLPPELSEEAGLPEEEEPEPAKRTVTLMALGDNLIHMGVVYTGKQPDGTLNYDFLFENITELLSAADVKIINQETIFGGNRLGFSGFPYFNSPTEVGDSIAAAGFNVVLHATNHSADQGIDGINNCVSFWKGHPEVLMTGIHEKETEENPRIIPILTIDDISFAILNYTYGPNMEVIPSAIRGSLDMLCAYNENTGALNFTMLNPQVLEDIRNAKEIADVVVVCPHWGTEYASAPSRYQKEFALQMTEAGADLIIGAHPHVVEPVEWIEAENGNRALCYYSLGNFVSTQQKPLCMLEAMAWVTFDVTEDGISISEEFSGTIPLVCHYSSGPVRIKGIYLLEEYTAEQASSHGIRNYGEAPLTLDNLLKWRDEILGDSVLSVQDIRNLQ